MSALGSESEARRRQAAFASGQALLAKFQNTKSLSDISQAIQKFSASIIQIEGKNALLAVRLVNLSMSYYGRFQLTNDLADLEGAIGNIKQSMDREPSDEKLKNPWGHLYYLRGVYLQSFHRRTGRAVDIVDSVRYLEASLERTPKDHKELGKRKYSLASAYASLHLETQNATFVKKSIELHKEALALCQPGDTALPSRHYQLGKAYMGRFAQSQDMNDLEAATNAFSSTVQNSKPNDTIHAEGLHELGYTYSAKYGVTKVISTLETAIQKFELAIGFTTNEATKTSRIRSLALIYAEKFERTKDKSDLAKSLDLVQEAKSSNFPDESPDPEFVKYMALAYGTRNKSTKPLTDLQKAIKTGKSSFAAITTAKTKPDSKNLESRVRALSDLNDFRRALERAGEDSKAGSEIRSQIAKAIPKIAAAKGDTPKKVTKEDAPKKEAPKIDAPKEDAPKKDDPKDDTGEARSLHLLAMSRLEHYQEKLSKTEEREFENVDDLAFAMQNLREATDCSKSPPFDCLQPALALLRVLGKGQQWASYHETAKKAVELVPLLSPRSLRSTARQKTLPEIRSLACDAAAVALKVTRKPYEAIRLFELARGIVISSINETCADIPDELMKSHPDLVKEFLRLRNESKEVENTEKKSDENLYINDSATSSHDKKNMRPLGLVIREIHQINGFQNFLFPPDQNEMMKMAAAGPIVIINGSIYQIDALIIEPHRIRRVPLPRLENAWVKNRAGFESGKHSLDLTLLEWLWVNIADPILRLLGFTECPEDGHWPRMWWIPTGAFSRFPIHAAGRHLRQNGTSVLDRVVSSYSPSVTSLFKAHQAKAAIKELKKPKQVSLVGPMICEKLERQFETMNLEVQTPDPETKKTMASVDQCDIFHFTGRSFADQKDPSETIMLLAGEPFTVANLFETTLPERKPFLAFLAGSATGQRKRESLLDEGVHLMISCQLAGFQHVIGPLWDILDRTGENLGVDAYQWMQDHDMSSESVAEGLHHACRKMRDEWVAESPIRGKQAVRLGPDRASTASDPSRVGRDVDDFDLRPMHWAPFVHYGL